MNHFIERLKVAIVWRLPHWLVYWCIIRAIAWATTGEWSGEVMGKATGVQVLDRWGS